MPRMTAGKRSELESFWRAHLDGWRRSKLNQREYCELHGLPLKRFGNWRAKLKHEEPASAGKLLYRRGGGLKHMSKHMLKEIPSAPSSYIPSARSGEGIQLGAANWLAAQIARRHRKPQHLGDRLAVKPKYPRRLGRAGDSALRTSVAV